MGYFRCFFFHRPDFFSILYLGMLMLSFFEKQSLRYENDNEKRKDCFKNDSKSLFFKNGRFLRPSF